MICLRDDDFSRMFTVDFIIFAENFNAMKLTKDKKNMLKGLLAGWAGMVVTEVLVAIFGRQTWGDTLWFILGFTIVEIIVGLFFMLGARVPKKNDENQ
jgi:hypothetical protein